MLLHSSTFVTTMDCPKYYHDHLITIHHQAKHTKNIWRSLSTFNTLNVLCLPAAIILLIVMLSSCAFFATREPEPPDTRRTSFQPPTSPQLVVSNLQNAIREKNAENYIQCLLSNDGTPSPGVIQRMYVFEPSAEAAARFASVFVGWNTARERQAFLAMTARIPATATPELRFTNDRFEVLLPDSAVYVAEYTLRPNYMLSGVPDVFVGTLRFTIAVQPGGFWSIARWSDQQAATVQATTASWSILKAQFAN